MVSIIIKDNANSKRIKKLKESLLIEDQRASSIATILTTENAVLRKNREDNVFLNMSKPQNAILMAVATAKNACIPTLFETRPHQLVINL